MSLAGKAARGAVWTIMSSLMGRAIGVVGTLIITRFLTPDVIGEVGTATIMVMTAHWLTTLGIGQYVVVRGRTDPGPEVVWHATVATLVLGAVALGGVALLADWITPLVDAPAAAEFVPGMALAFGIRRLSVVPERLLMRRMQFRAIGLTLTIGEATYAVVTVLLARAGHGGMSVVYGNIAQYSMVSLIIFAAAGTGAGRAEWTTPTRLSAARFKDMFHFGWPLAIESIAHNAARYWDNLAVRGLFGATATGNYNLAYNLADIPAIHIGEQIGMVLLPSMSRLAPERRPRALERATALLSLIIFPMAVGLAAVSDSLVAVVLPPDWQGVAPLLTVLSVLSVFRPIAWTVSSYLIAQERNRPLMFLEVGKIVVLLGGMAALSGLGLRVAAAAVGIAFGLHAVAGVWLVVHEGPRPRVLLSGFARPLVACAVMAAAVLAARAGLDAAFAPHPALSLAVEIVVGAVVYVPVALVVCRSTARDLLGLVREVLSRRRGAPDDDDDDDR